MTGYGITEGDKGSFSITVPENAYDRREYSEWANKMQMWSYAHKVITLY